MKLEQLVQQLQHVTFLNDQTNPSITSIEMDSREVQEGSLFICIKGYTVDGHDYVDQALSNGASAIIAERKVNATVPVIIVNDTKRAMAILSNHFYAHPTKKLSLIGITGTNGKTTVTHLIEKVLNDVGERTGLIGTMYTKISDRTYETKNTTPESLTLQKTFKQMVDEEVDTAIMEVSSHALHLGRVRGCDFNIAVFTNLTPDHLDYHETMEAYKYAKGLLFSQLGNTYDHTSTKIAILNDDDDASNEYKKMTAAQVITYGINDTSDVRAKDIKMTSGGTTFTLTTPEGETNVELKLIGKFSVYNALAATAACLAHGIRLEDIKRSLEGVEGVSGRFETVDAGQDFTVIVDYAHTADSLENVLTTVKELAKGNIYCVVGCGGDRDRTKRPIMAQIAVKYANKAIFTSDNPRSEQPEQILKDMEAGVKSNNFISVIDRKEAIEHAISQAKENDVVLIAGKGHETYQIVGNEVIDFDDRQVARAIIEERMK
ncbi:UDP-N-acetylmuramoyl-L-alanyl-D-glutamate--2,6-diaminopimelate ligase [Alkalihalobacterium elongatum]|uniref:UDP-N-acetylmuramoyl-L-alanyl-D-glutamate--2, 6-diaminopimelate ligase n=1 Tax=Alkalihalobacterium elongatum TaxID=2675466 RepID=UPI001C1F8554|nr:UDP-N-acetylmuramoyl-L-alanyl-D-glutamate--2,6-diaminopimelate ligase [Alkalihalobacterium elongatum]